MSEDNEEEEKWDFGFPFEILGPDLPKLDPIGRSKAEDAAQLIEELDWSRTQEGGKYWSDVRERLWRIAYRGR